jgi:prevent-host-death family protein
MKAISAADANRQFSQVLKRATRGETIVITARGKAVATLSPFSRPSATQGAAKAALLARLKKQKVLGKRTWVRNKLYE